MVRTVVDVICCVAWTVAIVANIYAAIKLWEFNRWLAGERQKTRR